MKVLRAVGMTIAIISLRLLMPQVWHGFEQTLLAFFGAMQTVLGNVSANGAHGTASVIMTPSFFPQGPSTP